MVDRYNGRKNNLPTIFDKQGGEEKPAEAVLVRKTVVENGVPTSVVVRKVLSPKDIRDIPFEMLAEDTLDVDGSNVTRAEAIWRKLILRAEAGDKDAIREVLDRAIGRPVQQNINLNGDITYAEFVKKMQDSEVGELS